LRSRSSIFSRHVVESEIWLARADGRACSLVPLIICCAHHHHQSMVQYRERACAPASTAARALLARPKPTLAPPPICPELAAAASSQQVIRRPTARRTALDPHAAPHRPAGWQGPTFFFQKRCPFTSGMAYCHLRGASTAIPTSPTPLRKSAVSRPVHLPHLLVAILAVRSVVVGRRFSTECEGERN